MGQNVVENYPEGTGKFPIAALMVIIIVAAGFTYALTSGSIPIDFLNSTITTNTNNDTPIVDRDAEIDIVGDTQMIALVEEHGFPGSGSQMDPYVIENLSIVSDRTCISIQNVESSFIIRDCELQVSTLDNWGICIYLAGCVDASVINCRIEGGGSGIELFESHNSFVFGCQISGAFFALNNSGSHDVRIEDNTISNATWGISLVGTNLTTVWENEISYTDYAIISQFSFRCIIDSNLLFHNTYGIKVEGHCENWTIESNEIIYNSEYGIHFDDTVKQMIVYKNRLGWNNLSNAFDDGQMNLWDYENGSGNSWHDYSGSGWYYISGNAESIDHYPMLLES